MEAGTTQGEHLGKRGWLGTTGGQPLVWREKESTGWEKRKSNSHKSEHPTQRSDREVPGKCRDTESWPVRSYEVNGGQRSPGQIKNNRNINRLSDMRVLKRCLITAGILNILGVYLNEINLNGAAPEQNWLGTLRPQEEGKDRQTK